MNKTHNGLNERTLSVNFKAVLATAFLILLSMGVLAQSEAPTFENPVTTFSWVGGRNTGDGACLVSGDFRLCLSEPVDVPEPLSTMITLNGQSFSVMEGKNQQLNQYITVMVNDLSIAKSRNSENGDLDVVSWSFVTSVTIDGSFLQANVDDPESIAGSFVNKQDAQARVKISNSYVGVSGSLSVLGRNIGFFQGDKSLGNIPSTFVQGTSTQTITVPFSDSLFNKEVIVTPVIVFVDDKGGFTRSTAGVGVSFVASESGTATVKPSTETGRFITTDVSGALSVQKAGVIEKLRVFFVKLLRTIGVGN